MTNHIGRIYAVAGALLVLFLGWAAIAAHPWDSTPVDPRVAALNEHRAKVQHDAARAKKIVAVRWKRYETRLADRKREVNRAWRRHTAEVADYERRLAIARANRQVIVRTVYVPVGGGGTPSAGGGSAPGYTAPSGGSGSGGGYVAPAASGSAPVASAPAAAPVASAPPIVSVGAAAPVTATRTS